MSSISNIAKAVFAGVIAGLGALQIAGADNHFTAKELIETAVVALSAFVATYWVPNAPTPAPAPLSPDVAFKPYDDGTEHSHP